MKKIFLIALILCINVFCFSPSLLAQVSNVPTWVTSMDDTNANYYETVKSFEDFWLNKTKPNEEKNYFKEENNQKSTKDFVRMNIKNQESDAKKYAFEYKKFLNWKIKMLPFVQEDGHILTPSERIEMWQKLKQNQH